eukprot:CAMPEP_0178395616 /NCGR_PEP_ID=MMETSP0689_2-20121128/13311_1 /TAXON_ID=160604 /ORGANISM="Amphidinium massartii, Strain CS-259" /LENGTH=516 /DNA_ID=CAMNT_0020016277 /DNA_START=214 /DNA_END=1760 /DNA_ORIENTATION=-
MESSTSTISQSASSPTLVRNTIVISNQRLPMSPLAESLLACSGGIPSRDLLQAELAIGPAGAREGDDMRSYLAFQPRLTSFTVRQCNGEEEEDVCINLVDITGHEDRQDAVRSVINCCQGALLVIDGNMGVDAPTLFTASQVLQAGLPIIPVLMNAHGEVAAQVEADLESVLGLQSRTLLECTPRCATKREFDSILAAITDQVPAADASSSEALRKISEYVGQDALFYLMMFLEFPFGEDCRQIETALCKLKASGQLLSYRTVQSPILGAGFVAAFSSIYQAHAVKQWLEWDHDLELIAMPPAVLHEVDDKKGQTSSIYFANQLPAMKEVDEVREPYALLLITLPEEDVDECMELLQKRRCMYRDTVFLNNKQRVLLQYEAPVAEICGTFRKQLKDVSEHASMAYKVLDFRSNDIVKLEVQISNTPCRELSMLVHRTKATIVGEYMLRRLIENLPPQLMKMVGYVKHNGYEEVKLPIKQIRENPLWMTWKKTRDMTKEERMRHNVKLGKKNRDRRL